MNKYQKQIFGLFVGVGLYLIGTMMLGTMSARHSFGIIFVAFGSNIAGLASYHLNSSKNTKEKKK